MASMKKQIVVRVSDSEYEMLDKVSKQQRLKRSDVVRLALFSKLPDEPIGESVVMSDEQHAEVMLLLGEIMTTVSTIKRDNGLLGSNVNQLTKYANKSGQVVPVGDEIDVFRSYEERMKRSMENVTREVREIWRTLQ